MSDSYSDLQARIDQEMADVASPEGRLSLIRHLTQLTFEVERLKQQQKTLLVAVRARDILVRGGGKIEFAVPSSTIELDPRDALDASENLHDIEWDHSIAFRWTGPGRTTLVRIWLDRSVPIVFETKLHNYGDQKNRGSLVLTVDGVPVALREADDMVLRSGPFPILEESLLTEVGIHVPWLTGMGPTDGRADGRKPRGVSRKAEPAGGDERIRGIAITHMRFSPAS